MDVPEDIWRAAEPAFYAAWDDGHPQAVANAILAERKRCADVARSLNGWGPVGGSKVAEHIATIIESGQ